MILITEEYNHELIDLAFFLKGNSMYLLVCQNNPLQPPVSQPVLWWQSGEAFSSEFPLTRQVRWEEQLWKEIYKKMKS